MRVVSYHKNSYGGGKNKGGPNQRFDNLRLQLFQIPKKHTKGGHKKDGNQQGNPKWGMGEKDRPQDKTQSSNVSDRKIKKIIPRRNTSTPVGANAKESIRPMVSAGPMISRLKFSNTNFVYLRASVLSKRSNKFLLCSSPPTV